MAKRLLQEVLIYAVSAVFSCMVLTVGLKRIENMRENSSPAAQRKREIAARLGRPIQTNSYEEVIAMDVVNPDDLSVDFSAIGGMEKIKESLDELVILPLKRPELFKRGNLLKPVKGVLLYGPPGTGKTMLAKALAKESEACFINVRVSTLQSKWFGDANKLVTAVFTLAWKLQPSIIFIDEIDSFLGQRKTNEHEAVTNMKTEFMSLWDGFTTDESARVMVLAATNRPWEVDEAILRRLPRSFEVPLPDLQQRQNILHVLLKEEHLDAAMMDKGKVGGANVEDLARRTSGYSGSDLQELCKQAAYRPIRDLLDSERQNGTVELLAAEEDEAPQQLRPLKHSDFVFALENCRPSSEAAKEYQFVDESRRASSAGGMDQQAMANMIASMLQLAAGGSPSTSQ
ncbi:hypothetical protein CYMTET_4719 [Cymbomonas tetramitiformis]|uniref:AAA+ ATPase domain-containing protein n=1 Tax=Cymbomonas tetramitiformis TaxID=36881 RepID=A0AAE0LK30_9CHLO|nr:hypothetical protein CYMTET_4719 [Cymbomonas tetramitiformis]